MTEFWVPGRIEVLGKHTDYAGGRSLTCALERGFTVHAERRSDNEVRVRDTKRGDEFRTVLAPNATAPAGSWGSYVAAVTRRLARDFPRARTGADIALSSTLPPDAGLSSSSALVVSIALALIEANELDGSPEFAAALPSRAEVAGYLGAVENGRPFATFAGDEGVGTFGGSEDHTAILCSKAGTLGMSSYAPVKHESNVGLDPALTFVVAVSGVSAPKTRDALARYNRLSLATVALLDIWNRESGRADTTLAAALQSAPDAHERLRDRVVDGASKDFSGDELRRRLDQFAVESGVLVPAGAKAFGAGDVTTLGDVVDRSQQLAETNLGNQVPETIALHRIARSSGAFAASAFGAGFGGSVWALVHAGEANAFSAMWAEEYRRRHPDAAREAVFFASRPGPGAGKR